MNSLKTWRAAPCIKAYVRDLKAYMRLHFKDRALPLMYTAQDSGVGAAVSASDAMRLTANYLSCSSSNRSTGDSAIDIFGINVESWCSSLGTFEHTEDGNVGAYYSLWNELYNVSLALVFAEMGCPHSLFNRDNDIADKGRDWKQVPVVLNEMADTWSGFCAYAYDGNAEFNMFDGGPWDGHTPLVPNEEFFRFQHQLDGPRQRNTTTTLLQKHERPPMCASVEAETSSCCDGAFQLGDGGIFYDVDLIPSYHRKAPWDGSNDLGVYLEGISTLSKIMLFVAAALAIAILSVKRLTPRLEPECRGEKEVVTLKAQYGSI
jgi:hypothetical protein